MKRELITSLPGWENYAKAFEMMDFWQNLRNTLFICFCSVLGTLISSSLVAYSFARIPWRGRDAVFVLVLATMMLPYKVTLITLFALYSKLGWAHSLNGGDRLALSYYNQALALDGQDLFSLFQLGQYYYMVGDRRRSTEYFKRVVQCDRDGSYGQMVKVLVGEVGQLA